MSHKNADRLFKRDMGANRFGRVLVAALSGAAPMVAAPSFAQTVPVETTRLTHLGGDSYAEDWREFCLPETIETSGRLAVEGGMRQEAREAFLNALRTECAKSSHEFVDLSAIASIPVILPWMLVGGHSNNRRALGRGANTVTLDTRAETDRFARNVPGVVLSWEYVVDGVRYSDRGFIPAACLNLSGLSTEDLGPVAIPPPPQPLAVAPRSPAQWFIQEGVVAADCCETRVVNGLLIAEYRGTVEEAQRYFAANLRRPGTGVQTLRPEDYQNGLDQPFAYLVVKDPNTGEETFWCMEINNPGRFSHPVIVTGGGRNEPTHRVEVRTREQFNGLVTGTMEFNDNFSLTGSGRGADISVVSINEPTPLTVVDADRNGIGEGFTVNPRTRRGILESQMSLIARTVFPVSADPLVNERADRLWAQIAAAPIPEAFITGRTEAARISALRASFPGLTAVEARQLASFLHYYGGVDRGAERGDQFVAEYTVGGAPRTVGAFFNAGVGAEIAEGVYPGVRERD